MTSSRGRHEPTDPAALARAGVRGGLQAPVRRVVAPRRGLRQQLGLVVVAAVALTVLGAGIGLGSGGEDPEPSRSGSAAGSPAPSGSGGPGPTDSGRCSPLRRSSVADFRIWSSAGGPERSGTAPIFAEQQWPIRGADWPRPRPASALRLEDLASIIVLPEAGACIKEVRAGYQAADGSWDGVLGAGLGVVRPNPPVGRVVLGGMPRGDWIVGIAVTFATDAAGDEDGIEVVRFFRVLSGAFGPGSPEVTPAAACGPGPIHAPDLFLISDSREPVRAVALDTFAGDMLHNGAVVEAGLPASLVMTTEHQACMTSWTIQWLDQKTGELIDTLEVSNPSRDPGVISQNRVEVRLAQLGEVVMTAFVTFGPRLQGSYAWEISIDRPVLPNLLATTGDGQVAAPVLGCGMSWIAVDGQEAYERCVSSAVPADTPLLVLGAGETLEITPPDLALRYWWAGCGVPTPDGFTQPAGCDLGSGTAGPIRLLPWPGRHVIQIGIAVILPDGSSFGAPYFIEVDVQADG